MFSMAVLSAMVSIAFDMVIRVSASFWATALVNKFLLAGAASDGMTSQAMQQGGMGLILTTLILTASPMAAMFFQGTRGGFSPYSQIGGAGGAPGPEVQPPESYTPPASANNDARDADVHSGCMVRYSIPQTSTGEPRTAPSTLGAARSND